MGHYNPQPNYKYQTERFMAWLAERGKRILDPTTWSDYMREIELTYKKASTRSIHLASLKDAVRAELRKQASTWTYDKVLDLQSHLLNLKSYKASKCSNVGKAISAEQYEYMKEMVKLPNWGLPDKMGRKPNHECSLWMEFLWETGMDPTPMTGILLSEITSVHGRCRIRYEANRKKVNTVEVSSDLVERIKNQFNSKTFLFESPNIGKDKKNPEHRYQRTTVSQSIKTVGWSLLHRKFSARSFRHTNAAVVRLALLEAHDMQVKLGQSSMNETAQLAGIGE